MILSDLKSRFHHHVEKLHHASEGCYAAMSLQIVHFDVSYFRMQNMPSKNQLRYFMFIFCGCKEVYSCHSPFQTETSHQFLLFFFFLFSLGFNPKPNLNV